MMFRVKMTRPHTESKRTIIWKRGNSPGALWSEIWLVNFERIMRNPLEKERRTQRLNREIRLKASVNLLVSLSTCGAERLDAPKLLSNKAKKRFNTYTKTNRIKNENHIIICLFRGRNAIRTTDHKVADDDRGQEERDAGGIADQHTIPHGFDPFAAEDSEHDHERVHEIHEMPTRQLLVREPIHIVYVTHTQTIETRLKSTRAIKRANGIYATRVYRCSFCRRAACP